jgi:3-hydroxyacyl-CoA dehydrogenase
VPLADDARGPIAQKLHTANFRESLALVEAGVASPRDIDKVITNAIGRRWAVGGPFEIWEQIGWDLVQVIAGELITEISVATVPPEFLANMAADAGSKFLSDQGSESRRESDSAFPYFKTVAVIGAGLMGHGIALEFASYGRDVVLHDISEKLLGEAMVKARTGLLALASKGHISKAGVEDALGRISTSTDLRESVKNADLVIEAASENLELKKHLFSEIDKAAPDHAILASNSSTFVPSAYGAHTNRPEQVVGIHYYNPPHLLPGVEIVRGPDTSDVVAEVVAAEYVSLGKKPAIVQREIPGFIGNRLQVALLREAMSVVERGDATAAEVDEIVRGGFGKTYAETGVFEIADGRGAEHARSVAEELFPQLANDRELPRLLLDKIDSGDLGVKTGKGFYEWTPESAEAWRANMADSLLDMTTRDL